MRNEELWLKSFGFVITKSHRFPISKINRNPKDSIRHSSFLIPHSSLKMTILYRG